MDASVTAAWSAARPTPDHAVSSACVAPWVSIEFDPAGLVYACCTSGLYPLGRIGEQRLAELWGGPRAQVLRESLMRSDLTVACGPCRWHLEHGRMDPVAAVYDQYPVSSPDPERPYMMLFALSNRCNLGCVMCTPELSTTLRHEAGLPPLVSPYDDEFFADLAPLLGDLKLAKFLGGEPFLAPEHKRVWSMMDDLDHPPRMQVTTNGTVWNDYVAWLLERFEVDISVSIDATTAATYAEVRRSDQFDRLMENLERFDEVCRRKGTDLHVSFCLMNRNAHEVADFLAWADRFDVPASINLVTDDELALHDAPLAELEAIGRAWAADDRRIGERFGKNDGVWRTQLAQMKSVIAERRAGIEPSPRQARRADGSVITPRPGAPAPRWRTRRPRQRADEATAGHVGRLRRWSEDGPVGRVDVDASGIIRAVPLAHEPLGIDADLCGRHVSEIVGVLEVRSGRPAWLVESADDGDESVRSIVLSETQPLRGTTGRVVRTIQQSVPGGSRILVAEDLLYEPARAGTPVALRVGSGAP